MRKTLIHSPYHILSLIFHPKIPEDEFTATVSFGGRVIKADNHSEYLVNTFTMVEENFVFKSSEILQNEEFALGFLVNSLTMVEENFEFQSFKMLQNEGF